MNDSDEARIWEGLRTHLDELTSLAAPPPLCELLDRRPSRRLNAPVFAGLAGALALTALVGTVLIVPRFAAGPHVLPPAVAGKTLDGPFILEIQSDKAAYGEDEPVGVAATLTYQGPAGSITIAHDNPSPIAIGVVEPVGGIEMVTGWRLSCEVSTLKRGVGLPQLFHKSGSPPDGMSIPSFTAFINDPGMPPGTWTFYAEARFTVGTGCGGTGTQYDMRVDLVVPVSAKPDTIPTATTPGP